MAYARPNAVMSILVLMEAKCSNLVAPKDSNYESQNTRNEQCIKLLALPNPPHNPTSLHQSNRKQTSQGLQTPSLPSQTIMPPSHAPCDILQKKKPTASYS